MITAVGKGTCTITVKSGDQIETINVTVKTNVDFEKLYDDYCNYTDYRIAKLYLQETGRHMHVSTVKNNRNWYTRNGKLVKI